MVRGARLPQALAALAAGLAPGHGRRRDRGRGRRGAAAPRFCPRGAAHDVLPKGRCWRARVVGLRPARCLPRSSTPVVVAPPSHGPGPRAAQDGGAPFHGALQAQRGGRSCTWADVEFTDGDDGQSSRCAARPTGPTSRPTSGGSLVAARLRSAVCTRRRRLGRRRSAGRKSAPKGSGRRLPAPPRDESQPEHPARGGERKSFRSPKRRHGKERGERKNELRLGSAHRRNARVVGIPGLLANRTRQQKLTECRRLLHAPPPTDHDGPATALTGPVCPTTRLQALLER